MTAHPQTQPLPGAVPAAAPPPSAAAGTASRPKGASRNARIVLGLSLLVATAGVSFAAGHMTAEDAGGATTSPFAAGTLPMAAVAGSEATATTDVATTSGPSTGIGGDGLGMAAAAAVETDTLAGASVTSAEVGQSTQAAPVGPPDGGAGGRPGLVGVPGGSEGMVAQIDASSLTITAADGSGYTFAVDGTTTWVEQEAIDASAVLVGDAVVVEASLGPGADDTDTTVATQVVLTTTGA